MPKKRRRPPNQQTKAKRGRGRPRKVSQPAPTQPTRRSSCIRAEREASASVFELQVTVTSGEYTPGKAYVIPVAYDGGVTPVFKPKTVKSHDAKFQLPPSRPDNDEFEAVVFALTCVYLSDRYIIMKVYRNTLQYIHKGKLNRRDVYKLVPRDIMHFFA